MTNAPTTEVEEHSGGHVRPWAEAGLVVLFGVVLTVWFTWPLAARMGSLGRADNGDGQFSIWNVAWVARALVRQPLRVFDANIFHPHRSTLAFSEANLGAGALAVPAYWATGDPVVAHSFAFLLSFALTIVTTYYLARYLTRSRCAALTSAVLFAFCPYLFGRTSHIQLLMVFGLPLCLLAMHRLIDRPTVPRMGVLGFAVALQGLFCAYYGVLAGLLVGLGVLSYASLDGRWRQLRYWTLATGAALVAVLIVLPFFLPYRELQVTTGFGRSLADAATYSADWGAYFASNSRLHAWMLALLHRRNDVLFPGFLAMGLGVAGLLVGWRQTGTRRHAIYYTLVLGLALWSSFGPKAGLYRALYHAVPVFSLLRAPARFGVAVTLALAVLSGFAVARVLRAQAPRRAGFVSAALIVAALADLHLSEMPFRDVPPPARIYRFLRDLPPGAVVEFPFFYLREMFHRHSWYMLQSTYHWKPLVNGYSDYIPQDFRDMAVPLSSFPNMAGFRILEPRGTRYVVFHLDWYNRKNRDALVERLYRYREFLRPLNCGRDTLLYEIVGWPQHENERKKPGP